MAMQQTRQIIDRYVEEVFNQGNTAVLEEIVAPDVKEGGSIPKEGVGSEEGGTIGLYAGVVQPIDVPGREGVKQRVMTLQQAFPDLHMTAEDVRVEGDSFEFRWTLRGTQRGEVMGIRPENKPVTVAGRTRGRIENGKIVELWSDLDRAAMQQQLGASSKGS